MRPPPPKLATIELSVQLALTGQSVMPPGRTRPRAVVAEVSASSKGNPSTGRPSSRRVSSPRRAYLFFSSCVRQGDDGTNTHAGRGVGGGRVGRTEGWTEGRISKTSLRCCVRAERNAYINGTIPTLTTIFFVGLEPSRVHLLLEQNQRHSNRTYRYHEGHKNSKDFAC